jgi:hypothetical protein
MICLAGCDIQIGSSSWPRVESQRTEQLSASLEAGSTLEIETSRGSITITGADVADCSITATIKAWADSKERATTCAAGKNPAQKLRQEADNRNRQAPVGA